MKPYYETELGKLYHGDCLDIMPKLEPVDLVLTDPPYGLTDWNNRGTNKKRRFFHSEMEQWDHPITLEAICLIREKSKHQILWGANHYIEFLSNTKQIFIWDKGMRGMHFNDCEIAWASQFREACRVFNYSHATGGLNKKQLHPTQKPVALFIWCIKLAEKVNINIILDPFLGSGTTAIACERLNRRWIGIEIEEKYCEIAAKRIENERKQRKLF